nr:hypothetical protein [Tanacetum cinerariifolium]
VPSPTVVPEPAASYVAPDTAGPSVPADKEKAPMPDLDIPAEFLAEDAQAKKRLEEEQASEHLVQQFTDSTVITTAAMDSAVTRRKVEVSPFAYSAADASPFLSSIAADQIPVGVLFESTSMNLQEFFLDSDDEMPLGVSCVAAEPDSDDEVVAEILF